MDKALFDHPSYPACDAHAVALVRGFPALASFMLNCEVPIPWKNFISSYPWLKRLMHYCEYPLMVHGDSKYIHGNEILQLHCHCSNPFSLQCKAAAAMFKVVVKNYLKGAGFNKKYPFYREIVNSRVQYGAKYFGSVYFKNIHYIYFNIASANMWSLVKEKVALGKHYAINGRWGFYIILVCENCTLTAPSVELCAAKSKAVLERMYNVLRENSDWKGVSAKIAETKIQKKLRDFMTYLVPYKVEYSSFGLSIAYNNGKKEFVIIDDEKC